MTNKGLKEILAQVADIQTELEIVDPVYAGVVQVLSSQHKMRPRDILATFEKKGVQRYCPDASMEIAKKYRWAVEEIEKRQRKWGSYQRRANSQACDVARQC